MDYQDQKGIRRKSEILRELRQEEETQERLPLEERAKRNAKTTRIIKEKPSEPEDIYINLDEKPYS